MATVISNVQPSSDGNISSKCSMNALRSILALPTASPPTEISPANSIDTRTTPKTKGTASHQNILSEPLSSKKTSRLPSPQNPSDSKNGARSAKKSKKKSEATSPSYFAGSAFQNSPDPVSIPLPSFDDDAPKPNDISPDNADVGSTTKPNKTMLLRRLLKVET